ncbi:MAG TPA: hypothetical protein VJ695_05885 [Nitrososphaera sp.]|nr:hypothetical protein [Nitrososphaera sp.]
MIRRGYIVLTIGGALFVAGIIIAAAWAIPFASTFLQENTLINQVSIEPGRSVQATTLVTDISRPVTVAIHIQRPGEGGSVAQEDGQQQQQQQQQPLPQQEQELVKLIETVKDPSGIIASINEFSANLFTTFQPQNTGNHVLNITNAGGRAVTIDATFGYMPFITATTPTNSGMLGQPLPGVDLSSLSVFIVGGILTTIGFFTIIAGIVIVVIDSRKRGELKNSSSGDSVTEGGITYRKD